MKIFLHGGSITERGTTRALIDYAKYLEYYGKHETSLVFPRNSVNFERYKNLIKSISENHQILFYKNLTDLSGIMKNEKTDYFYAIKGGDYDKVCFKDVRTLTHAVFQVFQPHGHRYAYNSNWVAKRMFSRFEKNKLRSYFGSSIYGRMKVGGKSPYALNKTYQDYRICENKFSFDYVPHIVQMPKNIGNLRKNMGIPTEAFVIGGMAGEDQFNLDFVKNGIDAFIQRTPNAYFIGVNIKPFMKSDRAIFLPPIYEQDTKAMFLSSLDLFINAREMGESFGLAICESLFQGVPALAWTGGSDKNQIELLGEEEWLYKDIDSMLKKIKFFYNAKLLGTKFDIQAEAIIQQFDPKIVINKFTKVFLD
jgi:glycosyltransferase involved in cell wall biosynthesis